MTITTTKRSRLTIDIPPEVKRHLRLVSARHDIPMREYVLQALEERLAEDLPSMVEIENPMALTARADPVLADLWDNEKDAAYDRL